MKKSLLFLLLLLSTMGMAPSQTPAPLPTASPHPIHKAAPDKLAIDLRIISIDQIGDTIFYKTDFGNYVDYIPFTFSNDSDIPVNILGTFTIQPVDSHGNPYSIPLTTTTAYKLETAHTQDYWDMWDGMPVYYGAGSYLLTYCIYPYDLSDTPEPLTDDTPANNCIAKVFTLISS